MSSSVQLSLIPDPQEDLYLALRLYKESGVEHVNFQRFVRRLATTFTSVNPGACLVAACPGGQTLDEAIVSLGDEIRLSEVRRTGSAATFNMVQVSVPNRFTPRQLEVELIDRYRRSLNSVTISHKSQPRFDDAHLDNYNTRTPIGQLVAFLTTKSPSLVVIRNAENIAFPGKSDSDIRAGWRMLIDIAQQSRIPHLIVAPAATVSSVVYSDPTLLGEIHPEILQPYHVGQNGNLNAFYGVLSDFSSPMPWDGDESLLARFDEIDDAIAGDVARLREWVLRAVNLAISERETTRISWRHFRETKPHIKQRKLAHDERAFALDMTGRSDKWSQKESKTTKAVPSGQTGTPILKPGTQKPSRPQLFKTEVLPQ